MVALQIEELAHLRYTFLVLSISVAFVSDFVICLQSDRCALKATQYNTWTNRILKSQNTCIVCTLPKFNKQAPSSSSHKLIIKSM